MGGACTTPQEVEYEVVLHTYNACTGPAQAFLGLLGGGGAYVSGIEVGGAEYSFDDRGCHQTEPGKPASSAAASEKERRVLGSATMTPARLKKIIRSVQREFKPAKEHPAQRTPYTYDLVCVAQREPLLDGFSASAGCGPAAAVPKRAGEYCEYGREPAGQPRGPIWTGVRERGDALCHRRTNGHVGAGGARGRILTYN